MQEDFQTIKPHKHSDRQYQIRIYPESKDRRTEALKLLVNARQMFFGMAEDDVGVPLYIMDENGELITGGHKIETRKKVADKAIKDILEVCQETNDYKFALAKLVGVYVNKMGVLADELSELHAKKEAAFAAREKLLGQSKKANVSHYSRKIKEFEIREKACQKEMSEVYSEIAERLPRVRLKNRKADIDKVLEAHLGELFKAATWKNENVHNHDYMKAAETMYEVDTLAEWQRSVVARHPALANSTKLTDALLRLQHYAKERINLRREDFKARSKAEVLARQARSDMKDVVEDIITALPDDQKSAVEKANIHLINANHVIYDMFKQGQKKTSVALVMAIDQSAQVTQIMRNNIEKLPREFQDELKSSLESLHKATNLHLNHLLEDGQPSKAMLEKLQRTLQAFETISVLPAQQINSQKYQMIQNALTDGIKLLKEIPGISLGLSNSDIIDRREKAAQNLTVYIQRYNAPQQGTWAARG